MRISVFKVNQLGDAVCFLPVLQQLLRSPSVSQIQLWTTPAARDVLFCSPNIQLREMPLNEFNGAWKRPDRLLSIFLQTRSSHPDAVLMDSDQGNVAHFAAFASGAKAVIGGVNSKVQLNSFLRHKLSRADGETYPEWCWNIGKAFARHVLGESWVPNPPCPDFGHLGGVSRTPFDVLIHPGASRTYKRWPLERYIQLATVLSRHYRVGLISPRELAAFEIPSGVCPVSPNSLGELADYIRSTKLFVGNNSGPMHLATHLAERMLFFSGPSIPMWDPFWNRDKIRVLRRIELPCICCDLKYSDSKCHNRPEPIACMMRWNVEQVANECRAMLAQ